MRARSLTATAPIHESLQGGQSDSIRLALGLTSQTNQDRKRQQVLGARSRVESQTVNQKDRQGCGDNESCRGVFAAFKLPYENVERGAEEEHETNEAILRENL